jgi:3-oxoacyl-(acyl-carrier-protein) synthase
VSGDRAVPPLQEALRRAHLTPTEIEWINAHGSSCPEWDRKETRVLKKALGEAAYKIPISGMKSVMGHSFGAAAAFQVASAVLAMQQNCLLPTINLDMPDPECDLNYVRHAVPSRTIQTCLVNSFGYGGLISFLLLGKS